MVHVRSLDHFVLRVRDLDRSLAFYHGLLGLPVEGLEACRSGERPFVSLRIGESLLDLVPDPSYDEPLARGGARGIGLSIYAEDPDRYVVELKEH